MYRFKLLLLTLVVSLFALNSQAQAATISIPVTEDAYFNSGNSTINNNTYLFSYTVVNGTYQESLLKFDATAETLLQSALQNNNVVSAQLKIKSSHKSGSPITKVFKLGDDTWTEGSYGSSTPTTAPAYDGNSPIGNVLGTPSVWEYVDLDVTAFTSDINNIFSLVLANTNPNASYDRFYSKEAGGGIHTAELIFTTQESPVPEPASLILGSIGMLSLLGAKRRK